jgi:hypothetical protein
VGIVYARREGRIGIGNTLFPILNRPSRSRCPAPPRSPGAGDGAPDRQGGGNNLVANCGCGRGYSVTQVLDAVQKVSVRRFERRIGPRRGGDAVEVVAEANLIRAALGWTP